MQKRIECKVSGRVQMVMYRDFVTRNARKLGIVGEVWNEHDGTVSVIAEGEEGALNALVTLLHRGSLLAHVEHVDTRWSEPKRAYAQFKIRFT